MTPTRLDFFNSILEIGYSRQLIQNVRRALLASGVSVARGNAALARSDRLLQASHLRISPPTTLRTVNARVGKD